MKASGIATCCLTGYTLSGVIACNHSDNDLLYYSAETAMWLGFASAAAFLVSWGVNASARFNLNIRPALTYMPSAGQPLAGLCLAADF